MARRAAKKILAGFPDYGKAPPEYVVSLAESLSHLSDDDLAVVMHPVTGVMARCKFLPTFADIMECSKEHKAKQEQFCPASTHYKRLKDGKGPWDDEADWARKAKIVRELLGYNPLESGVKASPRSFEPPTAEDIANLKLKTPQSGPTRELLAQLAEQGWPFLPDKGKTA